MVATYARLEFSMDVNLARVNRIPGDWGLEVGTLAEVYRNTSINRVCQEEDNA